MKKAECPAWGKTCSLCKRKHYFAKKCTAQEKARNVRKHVHQVTVPDDSDDECIHTLSNDSERQLKSRMRVGRHKATFQVDTGATVNTLPARYADDIKPTIHKLKKWNNTVAFPLGICRTVVKNSNNKNTYSIEFVVVRDNYTLLGYKTAKNSILIKINEHNIEKFTTVSPIAQHPDTFDGKLGALPRRVHVQVDKTIHPTVMPTRLFVQS